MTLLVAMLYVAGLVLIVLGAISAWFGARRRHTNLTALTQKLRDLHDEYQAASTTLYADMFDSELGRPGAADRVTSIQARQREIERDKTQSLADAGVHAAGSPSQDTWLPVELQMELTILTGTLHSLKGPGITALAGALCSTIASIASLYI